MGKGKHWRTPSNRARRRRTERRRRQEAHELNHPTIKANQQESEAITMNYDFKALYKAMFTEHWKLLLIMIALGFALTNLFLIVNNTSPAVSASISALVFIALIAFKAISTLIRASLLIHFAKKGHLLSIQIYHEWVN